jgi:hypothetical protein
MPTDDITPNAAETPQPCKHIHALAAIDRVGRWVVCIHHDRQQFYDSTNRGTGRYGQISADANQTHCSIRSLLLQNAADILLASPVLPGPRLVQGEET